jgi:YfiH family protein
MPEEGSPLIDAAPAAPALTHPALALPGIRHGFFTRAGGISGGIYASLNCGLGSADERGRVAQNRARVAAALGQAPEALTTPYQVHGTVALAVSAPVDPGARPHADALVTATPGLAIAVGTADCAPVLFADAAARVIGAAHAGWRGALAGVLEATVAAMEGLGARRDRVHAVLGPTISGENYEVGAELVARFCDADAANARFFAAGARPGHAQFDLPAFIMARLAACGVAAADVALCTYADAGRFFSFRRATHAGENDYGRQLSAIVLA